MSFLLSVSRGNTYNIVTLDLLPPLDPQKLLERRTKPLEVGANLHICDVPTAIARYLLEERVKEKGMNE